MKAIFLVCRRIGDGKSPKAAYRPWFKEGTGIAGWAGTPIGDEFAGNVFHKEQSILDLISTSPLTEFVIPIEVTGKALGWKNKDADLPANTHGKITSWIAKAGLQKLDPAFKKPGQVAKHIMAQVSGVESVDPLNGFRVHWVEAPTMGAKVLMAMRPMKVKATSLHDRINIWGENINKRFENWVKSLWSK